VKRTLAKEPFVQLLLGATLINHKGHHGHKAERLGLTLVSFVPFVVIQRRNTENLSNLEK
jgi:hypothetical protein